MMTRSPYLARLLVVEHDAGIQELLTAFLTSEGYSVCLANSPDEARALLREQSFNLVLTDLFSTSSRDRFRAALQLRACAYPIPVGVITGWNVEEAELAQHDFAFFLPKPFDVEDLVDSIAACVAAPVLVRPA